MIVCTMSIEEIIEEMKKDYHYLFDVSDRKDNKIKRAVQKSSTFPVRLYTFVNSPRRNRWLLVWEAHNKKDFGDNILMSMICIIENRNGKIAIMPSFADLKPTYFVFLPHFFSRYSERLGLGLTGEDLIRRYFQYNLNFSMNTKLKPCSDTQYQIEAVGTSNEGVGLGNKISVGFLFKTFLSYNMAKGDQIEKFAESERERQELFQKFIDEWERVPERDCSWRELF